MPKFGTSSWSKAIVSTKQVKQSVIDKLLKEIRIPEPGFKFITQTLSPKLYKYSAIKQFRFTVNDIISVLDYVGNDYCMVTELTNEGNVHYHFWIVFKEGFTGANYLDIMKYNTRFGFSKISKENSNKTMLAMKMDTYNYMLKDVYKSYQLIRCSSIVTNRNDHAYEVCIIPE